MNLQEYLTNQKAYEEAMKAHQVHRMACLSLAEKVGNFHNGDYWYQEATLDYVREEDGTIVVSASFLSNSWVERGYGNEVHLTETVVVQCDPQFENFVLLHHYDNRDEL